MVKRLTIDIPEDLHRELKHLATDTGGTMRGIILDLLREHVEKKRGEEEAADK